MFYKCFSHLLRSDVRFRLRDSRFLCVLTLNGVIQSIVLIRRRFINKYKTNTIVVVLIIRWVKKELLFPSITSGPTDFSKMERTQIIIVSFFSDFSFFSDINTNNSKSIGAVIQIRLTNEENCSNLTSDAFRYEDYQVFLHINLLFDHCSVV